MALVAAAVIIVGLILLAVRGSTCPRQLLGYSCQGEHCDHSKAELARTKEMLRQR